MKSLFTLFTILLLELNCYAQTEKYTFSVIHKDDKIGELNAIKERKGGQTQYTTKTNIETRILAKISVNYTFDVFFEEAQFQKSNVEIYLNGKERTKTKTLKANKGYNFYESGDWEKNITTPVSYCCVQLIFEEPIGKSTVYSEETGVFHSLKKIGEHSYAKENEKGRESIFHYKNGILYKAEIDAGIIEFDLMLQRS
ncbi:DUF6134 family protein [Zunongwangia sp. HGR-M22]|uniref:DUF6134 family protein n=1 Tax=Zunongwangia sp. HGR-M22 TaxID=3015168 RepID=UPI0022DE84ED|nr:DUF6134 family protein [Zunongwangia sp. HGR-M22]WBL27202.1 hypothetical protein PBT91_07980 [Zunongwangia sp. HGR-M22]